MLLVLPRMLLTKIRRFGGAKLMIQCHCGLDPQSTLLNYKDHHKYRTLFLLALFSLTFPPLAGVMVELGLKDFSARLKT